METLNPGGEPVRGSGGSGAPEWFAGGDGLWGQLIPACRQTLSTAAHLRQSLTGLEGADWSAVITLGFKAIELELHARVLYPFRSYLRGVMTAHEIEGLAMRLQSDRWLRPLGGFLAGTRHPTIAASANYLSALADIAADTPGHPLATLKRWLRARCPRAYRLWGSGQVARKLESAVCAYRNPYVHAKVAKRRDVEHVLALLWGNRSNFGIGIQTLRAITSGLAPPEATQTSCRACAVPVWYYSECVPVFHCPGCGSMADSSANETPKESTAPRNSSSPDT